MKKKILIVDDELLIRFSLSRAFRDVAEVHTAGTGDDACKEIDSTFYDICFLDINLPGKNGLEVMEVIRSKSPGTRVYILTANADESIRNELEGKVSMILEKPFNIDDIKKCASLALDKKSA